MKWRVSWDHRRASSRGGLASGVEHKVFRGPDAEQAARGYFARLCGLGIPFSFATCKEEK